jgi:hypothetical protein
MAADSDPAKTTIKHKVYVIVSTARGQKVQTWGREIERQRDGTKYSFFFLRKRTKYSTKRGHWTHIV